MLHINGQAQVIIQLTFSKLCLYVSQKKTRFFGVIIFNKHKSKVTQQNDKSLEALDFIFAQDRPP